MKAPLLPPDEPARLAALRALSILDTPPEERFDRITRFTAHLLDVPIALLTLVDAERQWFKSSQGLQASETPRDVSFCGHTILEDCAMVVSDTLLDERFSDNPLVAGAPHIRFYAGFPISAPDGSRVGTLCIADDKPRQLTPEQLDTLRDLATWTQHELLSAELTRALQLSQQNAALLTEIADRTQMEQALREKNAILHGIVEGTTDIIFIKNTEGHYILANSACLNLLGKSAAQMIGKSDADLFSAEEARQINLIDQRILTTLEPITYEENLTFQGTTHTYLTTKTVYRDQRGEAIGLIGIARDITERRQVEERLRKQFDELNAIYDLTHITSQTDTLDSIYSQTLRALKTTLHTWRTAILLLDEQGAMRFAAWDGLSASYRKAAENHSVWSAQDIDPQPLLVSDVHAEPSLSFMRDALTQERIHALGFIPLTHQKRLLGKLMLYYDTPHVFNTEDTQLALTIANHLASAIERKTQTERLKHQAMHDNLTTLPNRTLLRERLQQAIPSALQGPHTLSLLLIDLDGFKEINDTLGHDRGDAILQQVAARIHATQNASAIVARLGGDEFAVLLTRVSEGAHAMRQGHKIISALQSPFLLDGLMLDIGASIGIVDCPEHGTDADLLIRRADVAMYVAKQRGGGCSVYSPEHDQHSTSRLALLGELRHSIDNDQLLLYYQPKICLETRHVLGVEALVRWRHPTRGLLMPDQFIPQTERNALIDSLTTWVLSTALRQCVAWRQAALPLNVSVNLSARSLQNSQLPDQVMHLLEHTGAEPDWLDIEITESAIMADPAHAKDILVRLSHMGVRLSIDDFGTGYSSLSYLKKLPVDEIKVDKSFVIDMVTDDDNAAIVRSTIELAHNLNLIVVAEGVETHEIHVQLVALGCDKVQGYYFTRPLPADELQSWLLNYMKETGQ